MEAGRKVQIPVTWDSANRKKDKSVSMRFTTNLEVSNSDFAVMDTFVGHTGWLLYAENEIQPNDIPDVAADEAYGNMTPSQETRWLLKKLYEQHPQDIEWSDYYRARMNHINQQLRDKLND